MTTKIIKFPKNQKEEAGTNFILFFLLKKYNWAIHKNLSEKTNHDHKKRKDSLEARTKPIVLRAYIENQAILELILLYRASKCKQTQKKGSRTVYGPTIFTFCEIIISFFLFLVKM